MIGIVIYPREIILVEECERTVDKDWRILNTLSVDLSERVKGVRVILGWY